MIAQPDSSRPPEGERDSITIALDVAMQKCYHMGNDIH